MNKKELVAAMAKEAGLGAKETEKALNAFEAVVTKALSKKDGKVVLVGFGTFCVGTRAARKGRNPKTGEVIKIAKSKAPKFKAGAKLKAAVNK